LLIIVTLEVILNSWHTVIFVCNNNDDDDDDDDNSSVREMG